MIISLVAFILLQPNIVVTSFVVVVNHSPNRPKTISNNNNVRDFGRHDVLTTSPSTTSSLHAVVNNFLFNGLTGTAPSSLLPSSDNNNKLQTSLVDKTSLQGKELACVYKASRDGWNALDFHRCVDEKGSALVVALSRSGKLFGGFNPTGWRSTDDYYNSNAAFLWYPKNNNNNAVVKCPVLPGGNAAVFDFATGGPCFGSSDMIIGEPRTQIMGGFAGPDTEDMTTGAGDLRRGKCSGFMAYDVSGSFPVRGDFSLTELEVYVNAEFKDVTPGGANKPGWWPF